MDFANQMQSDRECMCACGLQRQQLWRYPIDFHVTGKTGFTLRKVSLFFYLKDEIASVLAIFGRRAHVRAHRTNIILKIDKSAG